MAKQPKIRLNDTKIRSLNFRIKEAKRKKEVEFNFNLTYDYKYDYRKKEIIVAIYFDIDDDEMPFALDVEYQGFFELNKSVPKKKIEPFARINCPAILFPFLRECIADITRRAGFAPLLLPAVNFVELAKKQHPSKKDA